MSAPAAAPRGLAMELAMELQRRQELMVGKTGVALTALDALTLIVRPRSETA